MCGGVLGEAEGCYGAFKPTVVKFLHHFQLACRFATTTKTDQTILLRFDDCENTAHTEYILVTHHSYVNDKRFEAIFFRMVPAGASSAFGQVDRAPPPILLRYDYQEVGAGLWPCVDSETELARRLLALSGRWEIFHAVNRRTDAASFSRLVTSIEPLHYHHVCQLQDQHREQDVAMRALRLVMKPTTSSSRRCAKCSSSSRNRKKSKEQLSSSSEQSERSEAE